MKRYFAIILLVLISLSMVSCGLNLSSEKDLSPSVVPYGIIAEVAEILEDGQYKVEVTGGDENFAIGDIVIINYDYTDGEAEKTSLKIGDNIAITYSAFEKTDTDDIITPGQIKVITKQ